MINYESVEKLVVSADKFQVLGLVDACCEFLKQNLAPENAIGIKKFSNAYFMPNLENDAYNFIM